MKKRLIIILSMMLLLVFTSGITYSVFNSSAELTTPNQQIAKFIFNAESLKNLDLPLTDLKPGDKNSYIFSVTNTEEDIHSNVNIKYQIILKTYHFIPLEINLYQVNSEEDIVLFGTCDETSSRNELNELVCNMPISELNHIEGTVTNYKLDIEFPEEYNAENYSGLVDFLNIELKSWQSI